MDDRRRQNHPKAWYRETKAALRDRDGDDCWICKCPTTNGDRTIDHWLPVSLGGSDDLDNLKLAHAACNRRRGNALPEHTHSLRAVRRAAIATGSREGHDSEAWRGAKQARAARSASPNSFQKGNSSPNPDLGATQP